MKQNIVPLHQSSRQTHLSRLYFLSKGCKQTPLESTGGKVLWGNGDDGYFMSAYGVKVKPMFSPSSRRKGSKANNGKRGFMHPIMRNFNNCLAHRLMFETFADEPCPIFFDSKGNPYKGIVHHVIENPHDLRMVNLMGWLTYKQHHIADKRRRALESVLPDMYCVDTAYLKEFEDPRLTTDEEFQNVLDNFRNRYQTH
ncbi:MAG: hypothetical protein IKD78_12370 [Bacteroidales bacterium]|nr:hypothetical protein [Bacteroidales bacterium]